jgi:ribonuclease inhibitor
MRVITIDCARVTDARDVWELYIAAASPEGAHYFGRNLNAFGDAVSAGGPGWPGDDCELRFINTASLKQLENGRFYAALQEIAAESKWVPIYVE